MILPILRFSFIFLLLFLFLYEFGIESIRQFLAKQKLVVESSREYTDSDHPAITVCAINGGLHGWRNGKILKAPFEELCSKAANAQEAYQCIKKNTFDFSDLLSGAVDGNGEEIDESDWKMGISRIESSFCRYWYRYEASFENQV